MDVKEVLQLHSEDFIALCKEHDVESLYIFGSALRPDFKDDSSDVDVLVALHTIDPVQRGQKLMDLWDRLEVYFQRKVDLLTLSSLRNPVLLNRINATKVLVYDGEGLKVSF
jgi:predicted nucleotidyltransferase